MGARLDWRVRLRCGRFRQTNQKGSLSYTFGRVVDGRWLLLSFCYITRAERLVDGIELQMNSCLQAQLKERWNC